MELIVSICLAVAGVIFIRRSLETPLRLPVWDKFLSRFWIVSAAFFLITLLPKLKFLGKWYTIFAYGTILLTLFLLRNYRPALFDASKSRSNDRVYLLRNYRPARLLLTAFLPLGLTYIFIKSIIYFQPGLYNLHKDRFDSINGFAALWLIGFGIYAFRQIKKEKQLTEKLKADAIDAEARKQKLEKLVKERTMQLQIQNQKLEAALLELKNTQEQLIQSAKMASLGELTAGIAHEIQNPLNFVNNFSEVSIELIEELNGEVKKGNYDEVKTITGDLMQNLEKINHHGKRAGAIVKGMLQHSRTSTGLRELTDINGLCDEYLRLAYHARLNASVGQGLSANDNSFNAGIKTEFDPAIGNISIVPQEMGRVLLNLINNAFYAVAEKSQTSDASYQPEVTVSTKRKENTIEISVADNGNGIPDNIKDKIFQPFFTTKPTGEGTGLGLSLSYDIVTKGHNGSIELKTGEGLGSVFMIRLPV